MRLPAASILAFALLATGCGDAPETPAGDPTRVRSPALTVAEARGERTVIAAADEARLKQVRLLKRDTPLEVGASAPAFAGLPEGRRVVLLFLRGDW